MDDFVLQLAPEEQTMQSEPADKTVAGFKVKELTDRLTSLKIVKQDTLTQVLQVSAPSQPDRLLGDLEKTGQLTAFQIGRIRAGEMNSLRFDEYLVLDRLGGGGMGDVFKAKNIELERIEAVKMIRPVDIRNDRMLHRLKREAIALAQMEHPAIVPVYKVGSCDNVAYIAMRFVDGEDLQKRVSRLQARGEFLDVGTACRWVRDVATALNHAHLRGIVHRDVKPNNLMIDAQENVILLDLGVARLADPEISTGVDLTRLRHSLGTPQYMPPEQWADASTAIPASDIYSLGCTFFFALASRPPFPTVSSIELMRAHNASPLPNITEIRPEVPGELADVIARATAKEPASRFKNAEDFAEALLPFVHTSHTSHTAVQVVRLPKSSSDYSWLPKGVAALLGLLLCISGLALWWAWQQRDDLMVDATATGDEHLLIETIDEPTLPTTEPLKPSTTVVSVVPAQQFESVANWEQSLKDFQSENSDVWESVGVLLEFSEDLPATEAGLEQLAEETLQRRQRLLNAKLSNWLKEHQKQHSDVWSSLEALTTFATRIVTPGELTTNERLQEVRLTIQAETNRAVKPLENTNAGVLPLSWEKPASATLDRLLSLHAIPADDDLSVYSQFVDDDGMPVSRPRVDQQLILRVKASQRAFITLVVFDEFTFFVRPFKEAVSPEQPHSFEEAALSFQVPGEKRIIVLATDAPFFNETLLPLHNEEPLMKEWFETEHTFEVVRSVLHADRGLPAYRKPDGVIRWSQQVVPLVVKP